jgi:hypothetical protein
LRINHCRFTSGAYQVRRVRETPKVELFEVHELIPLWRLLRAGRIYITRARAIKTQSSSNLAITL